MRKRGFDLRDMNAGNVPFSSRPMRSRRGQDRRDAWLAGPIVRGSGADPWTLELMDARAKASAKRGMPSACRVSAHPGGRKALWRSCPESLSPLRVSLQILCASISHSIASTRFMKGHARAADFRKPLLDSRARAFPAASAPKGGGRSRRTDATASAGAAPEGASIAVNPSRQKGAPRLG